MIKEKISNSNSEINLLNQKKLSHQKRIEYLEHKLNEVNIVYIHDINEKDLQLEKLKLDLDYLINGHETVQKTKQKLREI
jgi:hypothetical protein